MGNTWINNNCQQLHKAIIVRDYDERQDLIDDSEWWPTEVQDIKRYQVVRKLVGHARRYLVMADFGNEGEAILRYCMADIKGGRRDG